MLHRLMALKDLVKEITRRSPAANRLYHDLRRRQARRFEPDWARIVADSGERWDQVLAGAAGTRVLLATSTGGHPSAPLMDTLLAGALTVRGARASFLLCDGVLPACQMVEIGLQGPRSFTRGGPQRYMCSDCFPRAAALYAPLGLPIHRYGELLLLEERRSAAAIAAETGADRLATLVVDGLPVGEHARAGAIRYFARSTLAGEALAEPVLRRFVEAAVLTAYATRRLLEQEAIEVVVVNHAIYVPHGIVAEVARREGRRVVAWNVAYRKRSFVFSHDETYHHTLMSEPVTAWESIEWSGEREAEIVEYLGSRRRGGRDWIVFHNTKPEEDLRRATPELAAIDPDRPIIGLLTNVAWDAQLHYRANAFPDMLDWIVRTVRWFEGRPDLQLLIRVHPAELSGDIPSRQRVVEELRGAFPTLPPNVFVVPPDSPMSTYAAAEACDAVVIFGTKTGVELTSLGIPVIVAGEAWIRNKGLTTDATSADDYFAILSRLPFGARMLEPAVRRARKYAYHFFFRRMIPIHQVEPTGAQPPFRLRVRTVDDLQPGRSAGLDVICDGILHGTPFVYLAERLGADTG
ncbi:MAG: capsule biosynthesis protein [Gemmatimonadales bacterium]